MTSCLSLFRIPCCCFHFSAVSFIFLLEDGVARDAGKPDVGRSAHCRAYRAHQNSRTGFITGTGQLESGSYWGQSVLNI
ncbi:uncharacterized protein BDW70DRAFT_91278 [Aspergillus foveolatus]|uniref:uncharacterized protein n=1 Tax=Aspergillus foveolatus TaxID=210207 RepID=UPI003CCCCADE